LVVIKNIITGERGEEEISPEESDFDLEIENVQVEDDGISVNVKRNLGGGDITKIKFIFENETESIAVEKEIIFEEIEYMKEFLHLGIFFHPSNLSEEL